MSPKSKVFGIRSANLDPILNMESKIAIGTIRNNQEPSLLDSKLDEKPCTEPKIRAEKAELILDACRWRDVSRLRSLADGEDGLLTDALRREACKVQQSSPSRT